MSKLQPIKLRLQDWFEDHRGTLANVGKLAAVIVACGLLAVLIQQCLIPAPIAPPAPTVTATATEFVSTHVPTRTITPTFTRTVTLWPTSTPSPSLTRTVAPPTLTRTPTATPTLPTIPSGRNTPQVVGTVTPLLPRSGASAADLTRIAETPTATVTPEPTPTPKRITLPEGCTFHSWYAEFGSKFDVMTFRCPTLFEYAGQGVGASD
jgi:hypothetical protein